MCVCVCVNNNTSDETGVNTQTCGVLTFLCTCVVEAVLKDTSTEGPTEATAD